jgi:hypothetical protein
LARAIVQIINGSLFAGVLTAMRSHQFPDDERRCRRCTGRAQVFGLRDPETGYEGYCSVCNLEWHTWQLECRVRFCDRRCAVYCLAGIFPVKKNMLILFIRGLLLGDGGAARLEMELTAMYRFHILQLSWLVCPMVWWIESDSDAEDERRVSPILRTFTEVYVLGPASSRLVPYLCVGLPLCTLLDLVCTYLYDIRCSSRLGVRDTYKLCRSILYHPEEFPKLSADFRQCDWWMFVDGDQRWLWREVSREWFYVQSPPLHWCRYRFIWHWGVFYWWHNEDDASWFFEPSPGACYRGAAIPLAI